MNITQRPRRNRKSNAMRKLVRENTISLDDLIAPLFVIEGEGKKEEIPSMPGQYRFSLDLLLKEVGELWELGISCICLFPGLNDEIKDSVGTESLNRNGLYPTAIEKIKKNFPDLLIMSDVALDPYSSDGHDGIVDPETGMILNDESIEVLCKMAVVQAQAGADIIGPSDMMDGRVGEIRKALDKDGFINASIMSYTAKYASAFYGPFRDALESAPKSGDKKTYQMDFFNTKEALREAKLDEMEGADIIMCKPGLPYLDVIQSLSQHSNLPIAAYNVSGEYAMIKAAAQNGWLDEEKVVHEMLSSFKRAGADIILSYFSKDFAKTLKR